MIFSSRPLLSSGYYPYYYSMAPHGDGRVSLVIVEDFQDMVDLIRREILDEIHTIAVAGVASDSASAIECIRVQRPRIILVDLFLANQTSGFDVLRAALAMDPKIAAVVMTTAPDRQLEEHAFRLGARFFVDKSEFKRIDSALRELCMTVQPQ